MNIIYAHNKKILIIFIADIKYLAFIIAPIYFMI